MCRLPFLFDLILSAETLYSMESCAKVFASIDTHLSDSGLAVIASKMYYFGVGGGTQQLKQLVACSATLEIVQSEVIEDGGSNIREILVLKRRRHVV